MKKIGVFIAMAVVLFISQITSMAAGLSVEYQGDTHKLLSVSDDFFAGFGELMPGDSVTETVELKNSADSDITLYFHTKLRDAVEILLKNGYEADGKNQDIMAASLLENIELSISIEKEGEAEYVSYSGNLASEALSDPINIGEYKKGETAQLLFTIYVPKELNNQYSLGAADVIWVFDAEEHVPEESKPAVTEPETSKADTETEPDISETDTETKPETSEADTETEPETSEANAETEPETSEANAKTEPDISETDAVKKSDTGRADTITKPQTSEADSVQPEKGKPNSTKPAILGIETTEWIFGIVCIICGAAGIMLLVLKRRH